jgi:large subunit ribosomal protein L24
MNTKIRKDDKVMILAGKDKGKIGKVLKLFKKKDSVLVEGINNIHRHTKANPYKNQAGGIVEKEAPIHISNVAYVCSSCTKATRVGYKVNNDGKKIRYCKNCNEIVG